MLVPSPRPCPPARPGDLPQSSSWGWVRARSPPGTNRRGSIGLAIMARLGTQQVRQSPLAPSNGRLILCANTKSKGCNVSHDYQALVAEVSQAMDHEEREFMGRALVRCGVSQQDDKLGTDCGHCLVPFNPHLLLRQSDANKTAVIDEFLPLRRPRTVCPVGGPSQISSHSLCSLLQERSDVRLLSHCSIPPTPLPWDHP